MGEYYFEVSKYRMSATVFLKNLPQGLKLQRLACSQLRQNSSGSIAEKAEKPNTIQDGAAHCFKDVCVGEGVVFPKPEQLVATPALNFTGSGSGEPTNSNSGKEEMKGADRAWEDNTVREVFIQDTEIGADIICDNNYCVGEGVAFAKSSVEPDLSPLFDMYDKSVVCNEEVCVSEGVVFSRDELQDVSSKQEEVREKLPEGYEHLDKDRKEFDCEVFYSELDFLDFHDSGNVYWSSADGRKAVDDVDLISPLFDVFDKGMVCNDDVCVGEGVVFKKDQLKDTSSKDE